MQPQEIYNVTIKIYNELYGQCTLHPDYKLRITDKNKKWLLEFADAMLKQYGPSGCNVDLFLQYFEFQFSRYAGTSFKKVNRTDGKRDRVGTNQMLINWVVGKKAIETWLARDVNKNWLVRIKRVEFGLKLRKAFKEEAKQEAKVENRKLLLELNKAEEKTKRKYYNRPEGLAWCTTINTLYAPVSPLCTGCNHQADCKILLEQNYPNIYKLRMQNG